MTLFYFCEVVPRLPILLLTERERNRERERESERAGSAVQSYRAL